MEKILIGATRPALLLGVPIVPFILVEGIAGLGALWTFLLINGFAALVLGSAGFVAWLFMRAVTRQDDQRLHQLGLRIRYRAVGGVYGNRRYWASTSIGSMSFRRK
jgi:type IV secretory pathway VirB3-like protein